MTKYRSTEIVEARQFTGDVASAKEISSWFKEKHPYYLGTTLRESVERGGFLGVSGRLESRHALMLEGRYDTSVELAPNDWLVLKNGAFIAMSDTAFKRKYEGETPPKDGPEVEPTWSLIPGFENYEVSKFEGIRNRFTKKVLKEYCVMTDLGQTPFVEMHDKQGYPKQVTLSHINEIVFGLDKEGYDGVDQRRESKRSS